MDSRRLQAFVAVARHTSFTRAALELHLSQSAVSQQVAALEQELGARLFDRAGRRVTLTAAGAALRERAASLLLELDAARRAVAAAQGEIAGTLRIASSLTIAGYVLPRALAAFRRSHPEIELSLRVQNTEAVVGALLAGDVDVGFVEGPVANARIALEPLFVDELCVVAPPEHWFAGEETVAPAALAAEPLVVRERGSGTRTVAEDALAAAGVDPASLKIAAEVSGIEAQKALVEAGVGVSVVSVQTIRRELALGTLVARTVAGLTLTRTFAAASAAGAPPLPAARALVAELAAQRGRRGAVP
jgi:DNA-binding transcriptional LysR family regulator